MMIRPFRFLFGAKPVPTVKQVATHPVAQAGAAVATVTALGIAASFIAPFEGYFPKAYYDPVGVKTICYGITQSDLKYDGASFSGVYTKDECLQFLEKDLVRYQAEVRKCVPRVQPLHREASLISFVYNLGGVYEAMGKKEDAIKQYEEIYGIDATYRDVGAKMDEHFSGQ